MTAQKIHASTQKFIEIVDFVDDIVVLQGGSACLVIEITASNFALLSKREQDTRIYSYAALLNSLSFPIQILIRNKRMDITNYLKELDEMQKKLIKNPLLSNYIRLYRTFVHEMVTVNVVLNKSFYIVIPYSSLEAGAGAVAQSVQKRQKTPTEVETVAENAKKALQSKADSILGQLQKFAASARVLEKPDLIKLFYDIYNNDVTLEVSQMQQSVDATIITTGGEK